MTRQAFRKRFEVQVPARNPTGASPSREETFSFRLSDAFRVIREGDNWGARVAEVNFGGLTERRREFRSVDNGIELIWKLSNGEVFPVTGRTAYMEVELFGAPIQQMALSEKYIKLRQRFTEQFFYEGLVAEYLESDGKVKFADQTIYAGQALLTMATEAAILNATGVDASDAHRLIKNMLDAIDRLDGVADPYFGARSTLDGFFVRDDIIGPSDPRLNGRFVACDSDWQFPEKENASPSGDQIFGMMFGLSSVVHYSGNTDLITHARRISSRLFDYARRNRFVLRLPNGDETRRGSDMRWLSSLLHGLNKDTTNDDLFDQSEIEVMGQRLPLTGIASFWDDPVTARQVANLAGRSLRVPIIDTDVELNSFALHLMLTAIAIGDVWSQLEVETVSLKVQHHMSVLLYCLRHPRNLPVGFGRTQIETILDACPETGPEASLDPSTGWNKDNRWIRSGNLGEPSNGGNEKYNGIDWMLLHNLDQLVYIGI
jgi:hypothetical protein